jgi:hypothetical protein
VQQVTVRGPLYLLPVTRDRLEEARPVATNNNNALPRPPAAAAANLPEAEPAVAAAANEEEDDEESGGGGGHVPHSTLVGVTVEVAVAIAVASFLVGAASTGVLWLLHSRAERLKSVSILTCIFTSAAPPIRLKDSFITS